MGVLVIELPDNKRRIHSNHDLETEAKEAAGDSGDVGASKLLLMQALVSEAIAEQRKKPNPSIFNSGNNEHSR